jgi:hypothetical protein
MRFAEESAETQERPILQYSTVYRSPPAYIEEDDPSGEDHLSIDVTRWYNYHCNCVLHENLLPRSHFLIYTNPQQFLYILQL